MVFLCCYFFRPGPVLVDSFLAAAFFLEWITCSSCPFRRSCPNRSFLSGWFFSDGEFFELKAFLHL